MLHAWITGALLLGEIVVAQPPIDSVEVYYATKDYASVVRLLEQQTGLRKREKLLLGWSHYRLGNMLAAKQAFQAGLEIAPASIDLLNGVAFAHYRLGEATEAEAAFRKVLERAPHRTESKRGLAFVLFTSQRFEECLPMFDTFLRERADDEEADYYLVKSVDGLLTEWDKQDYTPAQMVERAWLFASDGHRRTAVEIFRWIVQLDPFHPAARLGLGRLGPSFGYEREALQVLESLLRENDADQQARTALATLHLNAGRREEAARQVDRILGVDPKDPQGLALRRELAKRTGRSTP
jgi:tetratricopeptide (TPR) repeat protein